MPTTGGIPAFKALHGTGNVYPALTEQQIDGMRRCRLTSNSSPEQLASQRNDAHQAKHIMLCSGMNCKAACSSCGSCGLQTAQRTWEYLSKRLREINQLRAKNDMEEPILGSCIDCVQVSGLQYHPQPWPKVTVICCLSCRWESSCCCLAVLLVTLGLSSVPLPRRS